MSDKKQHVTTDAGISEDDTNLKYFGLGGHQDRNDCPVLRVFHTCCEGVKLGQTFLPMIKLCFWANVVRFFSHLLRFCKNL